MMIVVLRHCALICVLSVSLFSGCGGAGSDDVSKERLAGMSGGQLSEATPVSGIVLVDGAPAQHVYLYVHPEDGGNAIRSTNTDKDGKFCFSTNLPCDGLAAGNYALTFRLMPEIPKNEDVGPDLFKGKYKNAKKSEFKISVTAGKPQTELKFELKK